MQRGEKITERATRQQGDKAENQKGEKGRSFERKIAFSNRGGPRARGTATGFHRLRPRFWGIWREFQGPYLAVCPSIMLTWSLSFDRFAHFKCRFDSFAFTASIDHSILYQLLFTLQVVPAGIMVEGRSQPWKSLVTSEAGLPHHEHKIALLSEDQPPGKKGEKVIVGGVQTEVPSTGNVIVSKLIFDREREATTDCSILKEKLRANVETRESCMTLNGTHKARDD